MGVAAVGTSREEATPRYVAIPRTAIHQSRLMLVRIIRWAGPLAGVLERVEGALYAREKALHHQASWEACGVYDPREPFEMTSERQAAIERAAERANR
jgi:hypothetical protein